MTMSNTTNAVFKILNVDLNLTNEVCFAISLIVYSKTYRDYSTETSGELQGLLLGGQTLENHFVDESAHQVVGHLQVLLGVAHHHRRVRHSQHRLLFMLSILAINEIRPPASECTITTYLRLPVDGELVGAVQLVALDVEVGVVGERVLDDELLLHGLARARHERERRHDGARRHRHHHVVVLVLAAHLVYEHHLTQNTRGDNHATSFYSTVKLFAQK